MVCPALPLPAAVLTGRAMFFLSKVRAPCKTIKGCWSFILGHLKLRLWHPVPRLSKTTCVVEHRGYCTWFIVPILVMISPYPPPPWFNKHNEVLMDVCTCNVYISSHTPVRVFEVFWFYLLIYIWQGVCSLLLAVFAAKYWNPKVFYHVFSHVGAAGTALCMAQLFHNLNLDCSLKCCLTCQTSCFFLPHVHVLSDAYWPWESLWHARIPLCSMAIRL